MDETTTQDMLEFYVETTHPFFFSLLSFVVGILVIIGTWKLLNKIHFDALLNSGSLLKRVCLHLIIVSVILLLVIILPSAFSSKFMFFFRKLFFFPVATAIPAYLLLNWWNTKK